MKKFKDIHDYFSKKTFRDNNGCLLWTGCKNKRGYGKVFYCGEYFDKLAHRVSFMLFRGPIPEGMLVCHKCDVPGCVDPSHLWLGTYADNNRDSRDKGRNRSYNPIGEDHGCAKLTIDNVLYIRKQKKLGRYNRVALAKKFKVHQMTISNAASGRRWSKAIQEAKIRGEANL